MKNIFTLIICAVFPYVLLGQDTFQLGLPVENDSFIYLNDNLPQQLSPQYSSMTESWDFKNLQSPYARLYVFQDPQRGVFFDSFHTADLVLIEPNKTERYFEIGEKHMVEIGFAGPDPFFSSMVSEVIYEKAPIAYRVSIQQIAHETQENYSFKLSYSMESIPESLREELPNETEVLEIHTSVRRSWSHMGTGSLILPDELYDVLCQKREDHFQNELYMVSNGQKSKIDISESDILTDFFENKTSYTYHFFEENNPLELAIIRIDENEKVLSASYVATEKNPVPVRQDVTAKEILAFPNPTFGDLRFNFQNYPEGIYQLEVYNVVGEKLLTKSLEVNQSGIVQINLGHLKRGIYLYSIFDPEGTKLFIKRFMIITP